MPRLRQSSAAPQPLNIHKCLQTRGHERPADSPCARSRTRWVGRRACPRPDRSAGPVNGVPAVVRSVHKLQYINHNSISSAAVCRQSIVSSTPIAAVWCIDEQATSRISDHKGHRKAITWSRAGKTPADVTAGRSGDSPDCTYNIHDLC